MQDQVETRPIGLDTLAALNRQIVGLFEEGEVINFENTSFSTEVVETEEDDPRLFLRVTLERCLPGMRKIKDDPYVPSDQTRSKALDLESAISSQLINLGIPTVQEARREY